MIYAPKIDSENTYFIFRNNGWEIEFTIVGELIRCAKKIHPEEVTFIRENLIKKIGLIEFEDLNTLAHRNRIFDIEELKEMIIKFKQLNK